MNEMNMPIRKGTYGWTLGPTYETPAEVQFLQKHGISAVGMSTLPEIERAHELKIDLLSLACLTNYAVGISQHPLTHEEVVEQANKSGEIFFVPTSLTLGDSLRPAHGSKPKWAHVKDCSCHETLRFYS